MIRNEIFPAIIEAIAYSRLVSQTFTPGECIALHQWANLSIEPDPETIYKYLVLRIELDKKRWKKPDLKYTEDKLLYYLDQNTITWKSIDKY